MGGVVFKPASAHRVEQFVRRVQRLPRGNPLDDGRGPAPIPTPVLPEVLITGDASTTCRPIYPGKSLIWNGCGFDQVDDVWVYEINDQPLVTQNYPGRLMMSNFQRDGSDSTTMRPLVQVEARRSVCNCDWLPGKFYMTITDLVATDTAFSNATYEVNPFLQFPYAYCPSIENCAVCCYWNTNDLDASCLDVNWNYLVASCSGIYPVRLGSLPTCYEIALCFIITPTTLLADLWLGGLDTGAIPFGDRIPIDMGTLTGSGTGLIPGLGGNATATISISP